CCGGGKYDPQSGQYVGFFNVRFRRTGADRADILPDVLPDLVERIAAYARGRRREDAADRFSEGSYSPVQQTGCVMAGLRRLACTLVSDAIARLLTGYHDDDGGPCRGGACPSN